MLAVAGDLAIEASYESFNYTELMQGERKTFYYSSEKLIEEFGKGNYLGSYFFPKGKWRCGGWDLPVDTYRNKNYTMVIFTPELEGIDENNEEAGGGNTAAPIFKEIVKNITK